MNARDLFVEEARSVTIADAMAMLPLGALVAISRDETGGPCPACGGSDRFAINPGLNRWVCRGHGGGRDAISLAAHVLDLNAKTQDGFLAACAAVVGRAPPDGREESDEERRARERRIAARRAENERAQAARDAQAFDHREAERARARGKWQHASRDGDHVLYLARRFDAYAHEVPVAPFLRTIASETYWHGQDERKHPIEIHSGPAMVAPFVDAGGVVIGCHLTWIDLGAAPKFRPRIPDPEARGELLPSKKMRGSKRGGFIPLIGFYPAGPLILPDPRRTREVAGEGIENVLAVALAEGPRADTLYVAAGDLGNLAGPAEASSRFAHPELRKADKNGVLRPVWVQGEVPKADQAGDDAMPFFPHVTDLLLAGDGDSEVWMTTAAMERTRRRFLASRPPDMAARAHIVWPGPGRDFTDLLSASPLDTKD